jgi:hypothetical protein
VPSTKKNVENVRKAITYETVRRIALAFPDAEDGISYRAPALKVHGKLFVRLREELDSIVIKMPFDRRDALMACDPESCYITDHYLRYPYMLVRLSSVRPKSLAELLEIAYRSALTERAGRR